VKPIYTKNRVIGLLGGSFNPAHEGHLHISLQALHKLGLDAVWWVVSPGNPLKEKTSLAPYAKRLASAKQQATHPAIAVTDIEAKLGTRYTVDTLRALHRRHPGARFVWLMGADNLAQFHRWKQWQKIFALAPVVVFDRFPYSHTPLRQKAWLAYHQFCIKSEGFRGYASVPALYFIRLKRHTASSTALRKSLEKKAS
jgi:nicotinate-nucleotide adenylyltransferase